MNKVRVADLQPLQCAAYSAPRPRLQSLSDDELLNAVRSPRNRDYLKCNTLTGELIDGNGRAHELIRRAGDPLSIIMPDTTVPVEDYTPDHSMFPDLN